MSFLSLIITIEISLFREITYGPVTTESSTDVSDTTKHKYNS